MDSELSISDPDETNSSVRHDRFGVPLRSTSGRKREGFLTPFKPTNFAVLHVNNPSDDEYGRRNRLRLETQRHITRNIILTPLEQNAPRRYKRIALVLPCKKDQDSNLPTKEWICPIEYACLSAYTLAMSKWPFLAGEFVIVGRDPAQIRLRYTKPWLRSPGTINFEAFDPPKREENELYQQSLYEDQNEEERNRMAKVNIYSIKRRHFMWQIDPKHGESFRPISLTIKPTLNRDHLILAFEFSESIFDLKFINTFLRMFAKKFIRPEASKAPGEFLCLGFCHCTLLTL